MIVQFAVKTALGIKSMATTMLYGNV